MKIDGRMYTADNEHSIDFWIIYRKLEKTQFLVNMN